MKKNKRIGIFFTGGLDSTYLVYKNLVEGNSVVLYYTILKNNVNKNQEHIAGIFLFQNLKKFEISHKNEFFFCKTFSFFMAGMAAVGCRGEYGC